ncbi:hypothetical protein ACJ41O_002213 [Fusarium nematophilum]
MTASHTNVPTWKGFVWRPSLEPCSSDLESNEHLDIVKIRARVCDDEPKSRRNDHYVLLAAEIPAWLCPWLRVWSSWLTCDGLLLDDYVIVGGGVLYTVFATLVHLALFVVPDAAALHSSVEDVTNGLKLFYIGEAFELVCLWLPRLAILHSCLRVFPLNRDRILIHTTMAFITAYTLAFTLMRIFRCSPIRLAWSALTEDTGTGECLNLETLAYAAGGFEIAFNVALLVTLLLLPRRLSEGIRPMLTAAAMIILGVFVLAVSCLRLWYATDFYNTTKPAWDYRNRLVWMDVEVSVLLIIACLPNIWPTLTGAAAAAPRPPSDLERQDRPSSSRPETGISTSTSTLKVRLKTSISKLRQMKSFRLLTPTERSKKQAESNLRLGDKIRGNVRTEIQGGQRFSMISQVGERFGIRVKTRTVTQVDTDRWDSVRGGVQEEREEDEQ